MSTTNSEDPPQLPLVVAVATAARAGRLLGMESRISNRSEQEVEVQET
jgi:hypothetical protein